MIFIAIIILLLEFKETVSPITKKKAQFSDRN